jgi:hypothetical protein
MQPSKHWYKWMPNIQWALYHIHISTWGSQAWNKIGQDLGQAL